jgi:hypothetical protein
VLSTLKVLWRWFSGAPLDGKWRTDARFWRRGTKALGKRPPGRWSYLPGWRKTLARQALVFGAPAAAWSTITHPRATLAGAAGAVVLVAVILALWVRGFRHRRRYVAPLHETLSSALKLPDTMPAREYLRVPVTFATSERTPATITLPSSWPPTADNCAQVAELVKAKLGVRDDDVDTTWRTTGRPVLIVRKAPQPPDLVTLAEMTPAMLACRPGEVVIGLDRRREVYRGSFRTDDPHWCASVGSRRGKSTFLQVTAAQLLRQDPRNTVVGVDVKRVSFVPLIGVPGFSLYNDPADIPAMWGAISGVRAEMDLRSATLLEDPTADFGQLTLMLDEINQFAAQSAAYWSEIKEPKQPNTPPVWRDLAAILWQGAQMRVHVVAVGQRFDSAATGGIGLKDSFGLRGLAGFRANQWKFLVGTTPVPRSSRKRGRWIWSDGEDERWVQQVYGEPDELAAYASVGRGGDGAAGLSQVTASAQAGAQSGHGPGTRWVVGLDAGAAELGISVSAFRKRRQRAEQNGHPIPGETRQGNQPAWPADELVVWATREESNA